VVLVQKAVLVVLEQKVAAINSDLERLPKGKSISP